VAAIRENFEELRQQAGHEPHSSHNEPATSAARYGDFANATIVRVMPSMPSDPGHAKACGCALRVGAAGTQPTDFGTESMRPHAHCSPACCHASLVRWHPKCKRLEAAEYLLPCCGAALTGPCSIELDRLTVGLSAFDDLSLLPSAFAYVVAPSVVKSIHRRNADFEVLALRTGRGVGSGAGRAAGSITNSDSEGIARGGDEDARLAAAWQAAEALRQRQAQKCDYCVP